MQKTVALVLALFGCVSGQFFSYQTSNQYQTSRDFNKEFVEYLINVDSGWVNRMGNGAIEDCQKFRFTDRNDYKFTVNDANNVTRVLEDRYVIKHATLFRPAMIEFQMIPGLLGANMGGQLHLYPLVATKDVLAVATSGGTKMVLTPHNKNISYADIKKVLEEKSFPTADLVNITTRCETNTTASANTLQRFLGFLSGVRNSPQGTPSFFLPVGGPEPAIRSQPMNPSTILQQTLSAMQQTSLDGVPAAKTLQSGQQQQSVPVLYASANDGSRPQAYVPSGYLQGAVPLPAARSQFVAAPSYSIPNYYVPA